MIVYRIIFPNGKSYIGATTKTLQSRVKSHIAHSNSGSDYPVHLAIKKYFNSISWEILCQTDSLEELYEKEIFFIKHFKSLTKENGYNVKPGGFYLTGTHGKNLSKKRKEFFSVKENRERFSIEHGGEPFLVYDLVSQKIIGTWVNQAIAAEFLNISTKALNNALCGRSKVVGKFIVIKEKDKHNLHNMIRLAPKPFTVFDKLMGIKTEWISKSDCSREFGISRSTIRKLLDGGYVANYRYDIKEISNG